MPTPFCFGNHCYSKEATFLIYNVEVYYTGMPPKAFLYLFSESKVSKEQTYCFWRHKRLEAPSASLADLSVSSEYDCVVGCMNTESCQGVNYDPNTNQCELKSADDELIQGELVDFDYSIHYSKLVC